MAAASLARPAQFDRATQHRRAMLAKINIARVQLGMDEDDYRQIVFDATGSLSLKAASDRQLETVLGIMKSKGFKPLGQPRAALHPMARKARAMWISLYHLGVVHNSSEQALEAFAKRQLGCDKLVWARQSDAYRLIEALKSMAARAGWIQHSRTGEKVTPLMLQSALCHTILAKLKEGGGVPADWSLDIAAFQLCGIVTARENPFSAEDYARLAAALGAKLRQLGIAKGEL